MEIINGAANGEKMELGTVFLHADICPLAGGHTCNFQMPCSHGCSNAARFWLAGLRFHLQTSLRTAQMKQNPCVAFWPCRTGLSDLGCRAESTLSSLQAAPGQGWCSEGRWQAGGKDDGHLVRLSKGKSQILHLGWVRLGNAHLGAALPRRNRGDPGRGAAAHVSALRPCDDGGWPRAGQ